MSRHLRDEPDPPSKRALEKEKVEPVPYIKDVQQYILQGVREGSNIAHRTMLMTTVIGVVAVMCVGFFLFPEFREKFIELLLRMAGAIEHLVRAVFA